ncbi:DUF4105 domain-containing protein [Gynuella sp.]|uniref:Lnb N-terminal periplasmic domain-containing protein n=1 Tax=Gynuella sp. TaxID=2969146 RepID=UPI003D109159
MIRLIFISTFFLGSVNLFSHAQAAPPDLDIQQLAHSQYWLKLGHYLQGRFSGYVSTADSDSFFLADGGKYDPLSELNATLKALYSDDIAAATAMRCKFPARYTWLEAQQERDAELNCPELDTWRQALDPEGLTLVFPTAYMNNPSSMFGHTLLRVDARDQTRSRELVAFAINFAAEPDTHDNPAVYALKGLIGSYPGRFTVMPYYRKVREYNDIESRDIWEYKLLFTPEEVERVLLHLWEMQQAEFDYFFLDENCSYQLLALLQLARDDLSLVDGFDIAAIPSNTVAKLVHSGLTQPPAYRPAFGTRLLHEYREIDDRLFAAAKLAKQGIYPSAEEFTERERAAIIEFAYEWLNFELYDEGLARDVTAKQLTRLLYQRSMLDSGSPFSPVHRPDVSPEQGHGSTRLGFSYNAYQHDSNRIGFEWRAAYHDMFDNPAGYIPGAKISFFDAQASLDEDWHLRLDRFYLVDSMALAPSNRIFSSLAWSVKAGYDRQGPGQYGRGLAQLGFGKAFGAADGLHLYGLVAEEINYGALTDDEVEPGLGIRAGVLVPGGSSHRLGVEGEWLALFNSATPDHSEITATWQWSIQRNLALRSELSYQRWGDDQLSGKLTGLWYF